MVNYRSTSTLRHTCRGKTEKRDQAVDTEKRVKKSYYKVQINILYLFPNVCLYANYSFLNKFNRELIDIYAWSYVKKLEILLEILPLF